MAIAHYTALTSLAAALWLFASRASARRGPERGQAGDRVRTRHSAASPFAQPRRPGAHAAGARARPAPAIVKDGVISAHGVGLNTSLGSLAGFANVIVG